MKTYFIRHTSSLDIDQGTMGKLWDDHFFAIHFPQNKVKQLNNLDNSSRDPADYDENGAKAMQILTEIARDGGYVCAEYRERSACMLGQVNPGSQVELIRGKWGSSPNREAVLKGLQFSNFKVIEKSKIQALLVGRPRQGTLMRWPAAGNKVKDLLEGKHGETEWRDLMPPTQESFCAEFLRMEQAKQLGLPVLKYLLLPVGRTMKDIDIYGLAEDGKKIFGQVTFSSLESIAEKKKRLQDFATPDTHLILFCQCAEPHQLDSIWVIPTDTVFQAFKSTDLGKLALRTD